MPETRPAQTSRGMRDLLPDEMERLRGVEAAFLSTCDAWGYREIRTPVIEPLHLFTSAGTLSPQALDRVYSFHDWDGWSGERVVLRPDSTIPAARLYAEHLDGGRVAKLCYSQNVFRFTDDGSPREEWQCGVELIGDTGAAGDVELVLLALATLARIGAPDVTLRLSHAEIVRVVLAAAGLSADEQAVAYDRLLEGDLGVVPEVEARLPQLNAPLHLLFDVEGAGAGYLANLRAALVPSIPELAGPLGELAFVVAALEAAGVSPRVQAVLARSFEYYSGLVMRIDAAGRRVIAGGRYDRLLALTDGRDVPASGYALYITPVLEVLDREPAGRQGTRVAVSTDGSNPRALAGAYGAAARLREAGLRVETVEGMDTLPTHRVLCGDAGFTLRTADGERSLPDVDELIRALGGP